MAVAVKTVMTYPLNSSTVNFSIPFEYLARKFITITLIGEDRKVLVLNQDYRFTSKTQITTTKAWGPADGYATIEVRRYTSATDRLVDFADGSILRAYDLNISQVQTLHVAEEARDLTADTIGVNNDGNLDARGRRIVNVADAIADYDAINLRQVKQWNNSTYQSATNAANSAKAAATSATNAKTSETNAATSKTAAATSATASANSATASANSAAAAKTSETNAASSKNAAASSASAAASSASAASGSAASAKTQADRAKTEADKLGNMNAFAGALDSVTVNSVVLKTKLYTNGSSGGLYMYNDTSNYIALMKSDKATRRGLIGFAGATTQISMTNDEAAQHECGWVFNSGVMDTSRTGAGSFASQFDVPAPFCHQFTSASTSEYNPLIKQKVTSTAANWSCSFSLGTLVGSNAPTFCIFHKNSGGGENRWNFQTDGLTVFPDGLKLGNGSAAIGTDGNIYGSVWGNQWLSQWINSRMVTKVQIVGRTSAQVWKAPGITATAGRVLISVNNSNSDEYIDSIGYGNLQYVINGVAYNVY